MGRSSENAPTMNVRGARGEVVRVGPTKRGLALPVADSDQLVDVWVMPGAMHAACLHTGDLGDHPYAFLLAYVDRGVRDLAKSLCLDPALCVDVWHFQAIPNITTDADARALMKHLAHAAADGAVPFSPIRPEARDLWRVAVDSMAALVSRMPVAAG